MKKIISLVLATLMLTALFLTTVSAENLVKDDYSGTFADTTSDPHDIYVKVQKAQHRYAVDIEFNIATLDLAGYMVWNTDSLSYDASVSGNQDVTPSTITITNRSDLPVYAYTTVEDADLGDSITFTSSNEGETNQLEVGAATPGSGSTSGTATTGTLTVTPTSTDWKAVGTYYGNKRIASPSVESYKIASVTVTVSKD